MFIGESFAATTLGGLSGILVSGYILAKLRTISYLKYMYVVNIKVFLIAILIVYIFNMLVSILPAFALIKDKPAKILSRNDVD